MPRQYRRRVLALLALGALSHHALDLLLVSPWGHADAALWPLAEYRPPTPGLYLSSDRWPALLAGLLAALVWVSDRRRNRHAAAEPATGD